MGASLTPSYGWMVIPGLFLTQHCVGVVALCVPLCALTLYTLFGLFDAFGSVKWLK